MFIKLIGKFLDLGIGFSLGANNVLVAKAVEQPPGIEDVLRNNCEDIRNGC